MSTRSEHTRRIYIDTGSGIVPVEIHGRILSEEIEDPGEPICCAVVVRDQVTADGRVIPGSSQRMIDMVERWVAEQNARRWPGERLWRIVWGYNLSGMPPMDLRTHPDLLALIHDINTHPIHAVLVTNLSQLSRDAEAVLEILALIEESGAYLVIVR